jgi:hypothetical protein
MVTVGIDFDTLLIGKISSLVINKTCVHFEEGTVSADIFCAEITVGKSQRLKKITTAVGKSKHEF